MVLWTVLWPAAASETLGSTSAATRTSSVPGRRGRILVLVRLGGLGRLVLGLVLGLVFGLVLGLVFGLVLGLVLRLVFGLVAPSRRRGRGRTRREDARDGGGVEARHECLELEVGCHCWLCGRGRGRGRVDGGVVGGMVRGASVGHMRLRLRLVRMRMRM
jgi:hypothetical protein